MLMENFLELVRHFEATIDRSQWSKLIDPPPKPRKKCESFGDRLMLYCDKLFYWLRNVDKKFIPIQFTTGYTGGWILGYFYTKQNKLAAFLISCSFIIFQFFNYRGYIHLYRSRSQYDMDILFDKWKKQLGYRQGFPSPNETYDFLTRYGYFFSGIAAGNLIGYGMTA